MRQHINYSCSYFWQKHLNSFLSRWSLPAEKTIENTIIIHFLFSKGEAFVCFGPHCLSWQGNHEKVPHCVHPVDVGADLCEDSGLLEDVAALTGAKAHHTMDVPGAVRVLAIQGATRVSLWVSTHIVCQHVYRHWGGMATSNHLVIVNDPFTPFPWIPRLNCYRWWLP